MTNYKKCHTHKIKFQKNSVLNLELQKHISSKHFYLFFFSMLELVSNHFCNISLNFQNKIQPLNLESGMLPSFFTGKMFFAAVRKPTVNYPLNYDQSKLNSSHKIFIVEEQRGKEVTSLTAEISASISFVKMVDSVGSHNKISISKYWEFMGTLR